MVSPQLREDVPAVQRAAHREEEDARKEEDPEPGVQRVVRVRGAGCAQRHAGSRLTRAACAGLGQSH